MTATSYQGTKVALRGGSSPYPAPGSFLSNSGVVAYLGDGACFAVSEQITHLLSQQKNINKMRRQKEDDQYVHGFRFQSPYYGPQQQADDAVAKKTFSAYGFVSNRADSFI